MSPQYGPGRAIMGWFTHSIADQRHELWTAHVDIWTVDIAAVRGVYSGFTLIIIIPSTAISISVIGGLGWVTAIASTVAVFVVVVLVTAALVAVVLEVRWATGGPQ